MTRPARQPVTEPGVFGQTLRRPRPTVRPRFTDADGHTRVAYAVAELCGLLHTETGEPDRWCFGVAGRLVGRLVDEPVHAPPPDEGASAGEVAVRACDVAAAVARREGYPADARDRRLALVHGLITRAIQSQTMPTDWSITGERTETGGWTAWTAELDGDPALHGRAAHAVALLRLAAELWPRSSWAEPGHAAALAAVRRLAGKHALGGRYVEVARRVVEGLKFDEGGAGASKAWIEIDAVVRAVSRALGEAHAMARAERAALARRISDVEMRPAQRRRCERALARLDAQEGAVYSRETLLTAARELAQEDAHAQDAQHGEAAS